MDVKNVYSNLTNVDIEEQKMLWDDRGRGYYGEYLVFCELYKNIIGNCKILMNLNIPIDNDKTTEVDLVMIHEKGIFVFEIKHYKGTIYGDDNGQIWTQYFRTVKNNVFKNPVLQNEYHINAIKKIFPTIPIQSVIVFTSNDCNIKVNRSNPNIDICDLYNLIRILNTRFNSMPSIYSIAQIDEMFSKLSGYSNMKEIIPYNGKEEPFIKWLQPTINTLEIEKNNLIKQKESLEKNKRRNTILFIIIIFACIVFSLASIYIVKENYNDKLNIFKQNFKHIDEIDNQYIKAANDFVNVSNISITPITDYAVTFSARLAMNNDLYGIALQENSKYIVMTNSGEVYEYNVFGEHLTYNAFANKIGKGIREYGDLANAQFYGVYKEEITYIKITNIELFKIDIMQTTIKNDIELEVYSKSI